MSAPSSPVRLFIGSSAEGQSIAAHLQDQLESRNICEVDLWQHVFEPSGYALPSLVRAAEGVDFAVLLATPDDTTISRGEETRAVRDNIILEFGLFAGALGLERTYLLATGNNVKLPSDVFGLTRLPYRVRSDDNIAAALNSAVLAIQRQVTALGPRPRDGAPASAAAVGRDAPASGELRAKALGQPGTGAAATAAPLPSSGRAPLTAAKQRQVLHKELQLLHDNATAQGWAVKNNNKTTLRIASPKGKVFVLSKGTTAKTRTDLRTFAEELRKGGLRVNSALLRPEDESPFLE